MARDPAHAGGEKKIYERTDLGKENKMGHVRRLGWDQDLEWIVGKHGLAF